MNIRVTFDDREHAIKEAFTACIAGREDVQMDSRRLDMGDIIIQPAQSTTPLVVVERKQVTDLMSSLFDGRLAEQCSRMQQWKAEQTVADVWTVLIVEGCAGADTFRATNPEVRYRHFLKTYIQLALDANPVCNHLILRTTSVEETATVLLTLHKTVTAGVDGANRVLVLPRKSQSDPFVRHLSCTQGVSVQRAMRIRERYQNVFHLGKAMETNPYGTIDVLKGIIGSVKVAVRLLEDLGHTCPRVNQKRPRRTHSSPTTPEHSPASSGTGS